MSSAAAIHQTFSSRRRNFMLTSHRKDALIEWMKDMLNHSFVLDAKDTYMGTMKYFEELIDEHIELGSRSRLKQYVPTIGKFHTRLCLGAAFTIYDTKYSISKRRFVAPSFNEIRHILNLSQIMSIGTTLELITFDGDQTLYDDGGNFGDTNEELAIAIMSLLVHGVKVAVVTAAGYGLDGSKYELRLQALLDRFVVEGLTKEHIECFYVFGGECNYLLQCTLESDSDSVRACLKPVPVEEWQAEHLLGPKPYYWPEEEVTQLLDCAESSFRSTIKDLNLRAKVLRKPRAVGVFPGGVDMCKTVPIGHGSKKLKREALDELVMRVMEAVRVHEPAVQLPYCVFNGGRDAWLDVGNKSVGVAALQAFFGFPQAHCLHVGDQFLNTGNDIAARENCPCIWIINPRETGKVLQHVLKYREIPALKSIYSRESRHGSEDFTANVMNVFRKGADLGGAKEGGGGGASPGRKPKIDVYTGEVIP